MLIIAVVSFLSVVHMMSSTSNFFFLGPEFSRPVALRWKRNCRVIKELRNFKSLYKWFLLAARNAVAVWLLLLIFEEHEVYSCFVLYYLLSVTYRQGCRYQAGCPSVVVVLLVHRHWGGGGVDLKNEVNVAHSWKRGIHWKFQEHRFVLLWDRCWNVSWFRGTDSFMTSCWSLR